MGTFIEFKVDVKGDHLSSNLNVCWINVIFSEPTNLGITQNQVFLITFLSPLPTHFKSLENIFEDNMTI